MHTLTCVEKWPSQTHTHTHAERAFLRCSVRLSLALILISRKGKSLLGAVGAWGESSVFSVTHSNTETACYWLFVNDSFQLNYAIISYLRFDIIQSCVERSTRVPVDSWRKQTFHESEHRRASSPLKTLIQTISVRTHICFFQFLPALYCSLQHCLDHICHSHDRSQTFIVSFNAVRPCDIGKNISVS